MVPSAVQFALLNTCKQRRVGALRRLKVCLPQKLWAGPGKLVWWVGGCRWRWRGDKAAAGVVIVTGGGLRERREERKKEE